MATIDKNFKVKNGLVVEGTTATVNGHDVLTTANSTDDLQQGSTNKYYSTSQAQTDAASLLTNATLSNITITGDGSGLTITAENGGVQTGDDASFNTVELTSNGAGVNIKVGDDAYVGDVNLSNTINIQGVENENEGFVSFGQNGSLIDSTGQKLNYVGFDGSDLNVVSSGDIVLNADGTTYLGSVTAGNAVATQSYVNNQGFITSSDIPASYITNIDSNVFNVDSGTLQLNSVVSAPGTEVHISKLELHLPDDTNLGAVVAHPYDGSLTVAAINQLNLESHSGDINLTPDSGNVYVSGNITTTGTNNITASNNLYAGSGSIIGGADYGNDGFLQVKDANGTTNISLGASVAGASLEIHGSQTFYASINDGGTQYGNIGYDGGKNLVINGNYNDIILESDSGYAYIGNNSSPATRIATQSYVDSVAQGLNVKLSAVAIISNPVNIAADLVVGYVADDITLIANDRVVVAGNAGDENGIYVIQASGGAIRSADQAEPQKGDFVFIESGTNYAKTGWIVSNVYTGTTATTWTQFSAAGEYTAGTGITISGAEISVTANTYDTYGAASTAESNAKSYADGLAGNYDISGAAATAESNAKGYADGLASNYDPAGAASTAESNAKGYADGLASNYDPSGSAATAQSNAEGYTDSAISNGNISATPSYAGVQLGYYSREVAGYASGNTGDTLIPFTLPAGYKSGKFVVRVMSNVTGDSQMSEILVTADNSNNVAITEYAIVSTNGDMGSVSAEANVSNQIVILVVPTHDNSEVMISGTIFTWND